MKFRKRIGITKRRRFNLRMDTENRSSFNQNTSKRQVFCFADEEAEALTGEVTFARCIVKSWQICASK